MLLVLALLILTVVPLVVAKAPDFDRTNPTDFDDAFQSTVNILLESYNVSTGVFNFPSNCGGNPKGWWNSANAFTAIALKDLRHPSSTNLPLLRSVLDKTIQDSGDFRPTNNLMNDDQLWWVWFACEAAHLDPEEPRWLRAATKAWNEATQCVTKVCVTKELSTATHQIRGTSHHSTCTGLWRRRHHMDQRL
jgi:hypothetical protein